MFADIMKRSIKGFIMGMAIGNVIFIILGYANMGYTIFAAPELISRMGNELNAFALQTLLSGVYGAVCMGAQSLYYMERCPLALATALHYVIVVAVYAPIAYGLCWVSDIAEYLIVVAVMSVVYVFIWLSMSISYRIQIKELNLLQEKYCEKMNNAV